MKTLTITFAKTRSVAQVVKDLKFHFEWKSATVAYTKGGEPLLTYVRNDGTKVGVNLLFTNDIFEEEGEDQTFDECFEYTYSLWGKDAEGKWYLGYSD